MGNTVILGKWNFGEVLFTFQIAFKTENSSPVFAVEGPGCSLLLECGMSEAK